jgi:hypothetical protein
MRPSHSEPEVAPVALGYAESKKNINIKTTVSSSQNKFKAAPVDPVVENAKPWAKESVRIPFHKASYTLHPSPLNMQKPG